MYFFLNINFKIKIYYNCLKNILLIYDFLLMFQTCF